MRVSLDLHDFSVINNQLDLLLEIRDRYPDFKLSAFTIPHDYEHENSQRALYRERELKRIHDNLDWIQLIPHGLTHMPREFEHCDRHTMKMVLKSIDEAFTKDRLPYEKGFCAPYWLWNQDVVDILDENGWWGALDRNQPDMLKTQRSYVYSHSIDEPFWRSDRPVLKLHGHMTPPSTNDLQSCLVNILKLPTDVEWCYVTDLLDE